MKDNKTNLEANMEEILDLDPNTQSIIEHEVVPTPNTAITPVEEEDKIQKDYEYARENLKDIINNGQNTLQELSAIASTSESPRAFEVLSTLMKTIVDANKDLLELQKKVKTLNDGVVNKQPSTVNNSLFVGSTAELQKLINKDK